MTQFDLSQVVSMEITQSWMEVDTARITLLGVHRPERGNYILIAFDSDFVFAGRVINYHIRRGAGQPYFTEVLVASPLWYLTKQYIPSEYSYLIPGVTDNPRDYIRVWLGDRQWSSTTGLNWEDGWLMEVPNWSEEYAYQLLHFNPTRHTKWDGLLAICDKYSMGFYAVPEGAFDFYEFRFYTEEWLHLVFDKSDYIKELSESDLRSFEVFYDYSPDSRFNRVLVTGQGKGSEWDYIFAQKEDNFVTWKDIRPVEYCYEVPEIDVDEAAVYADTLLERFEEKSPLITVTTRKLPHIGGRYYLPGLRVELSGFGDILEQSLWRIYRVTHHFRAGEEPSTTLYLADFEDLSHPFVASENPFRKLGEEVTNKILKSVGREHPGSVPRSLRESLGGPTALKPVQILEIHDDGTADVKVLETGEEFKNVKIL